ncbi:virulence-associated E family protein [Lysinibacillus sp. KU-BSD001]|uniref:VapE domain-containing protein n=1 Tax=Lysinibacillus sp. KU-BSD001 TaxID=3141328 RepID=UPI0036F11354
MTQKQPGVRLKHNAKVTIATASSCKSMSWKNKEVMYSELVEKLSQFKTLNIPQTEYMKLPKSKQDELKNVGGFVGASLEKGRRKVENIKERNLVTLDADFIVGSFWDGVTSIFDNACLVYSTVKHTQEKPRLRLVIPLSKPVTAEEYVAVAKKLAEQFGIDYFDDTTYQPHRLMYWPTKCEGEEGFFDYQDAPFLNPDDILALYDNWRDPREWPESSRQRETRKRTADKQGNPLEKPGMVGAFCRTYSISEAIETFLSDKYEPAGEGRYSFLGGSTTGGLVVYDDVFAYSHHGTDPISEKLVNAFDLVRVHLYGELDDEAKEGTPINRIPSTKAFEDYLRTSKDEKAVKVRTELMMARHSTAEEDFLDEVDTEIVAQNERQDNSQQITKSLLSNLSCNRHGDIEPTTKNIEIIIKNLYGECFKFDAFASRAVRIKNVPWRKFEKLKSGEYTLWDDFDTEAMLIEIEKTFGFNIQYSKARLIVEKAIHANYFNPVQDVIKSVEWDGLKRAETLLIDYLGASDSEYTRLSTIHFLKGIIYRILEPGCKFDECLVLSGDQGIGKSLFARNLAIQESWYTDSLESFEPKKGGELLQGKLIIELGELAAMRKSEVEDVKRFISAQSDYFRGAYKRTAQEFKRQCVFIGTTNESEFLIDATGNRRFLPIECNAVQRKKHSADLSKETVLQIYAEVLERFYVPYKPVYMDDKLKSLSSEIQKESMVSDPLLSDVLIYLNKPIPANFDKMGKQERRLYINSMQEAAPADFDNWDDTKKVEWFMKHSDGAVPKESLQLMQRVSAKELAEEGLKVDTLQLKPFHMRRYSQLLRQAGWIQESGNAKKITTAYGQQKVFARPKN